MNNRRFDALLIEALPEPPSEIINSITPWQRAFRMILIGLGMTSVTLNFLCLQYLLPAIGMLLLLLGFRRLRKENEWFTACFALSVLRCILFYPSLILYATVYSEALAQNGVFSILSGIQITLLFLLIGCLHRGIRKLQSENGLKPHAASAVGLLIWYAIVCIFGISGYSGLLLGIPMLLCYLLMLYCLHKLSKEIATAGYAASMQQTVLSDGAVAGSIAVLTAVGILCGAIFFSDYPMHWTPQKQDEHSHITDICQKLTDLGFPKEILADMNSEDILQMQDAFQVTVTQHEHPVNDGREVVEVEDDTYHHTTVYDQNELRITQIAVELSGDCQRFYLVHHFEWVITPKFYGTEAMQFWTADRLDGWMIEHEPSGRLLYSENGTEYTANYYTLGTESYQYNSLFADVFGKQQKSDLFAAFSMPNTGERHRGYISYGIIERTDGCIIDSWINYVHQKHPWQYPHTTAKQHRKTRSGLDDRVFHLTQDALQLTPYPQGEYRLFS